MTETNTQREAVRRLADKIWNMGGKYTHNELDDIIATELTKVREEGRNQEKTEVSEACKRLAGLADFNHVSDEMRSSATLFLQRKAEEDKSNYIKFLQEKPEQALQSYR